MSVLRNCLQYVKRREQHTCTQPHHPTPIIIDLFQAQRFEGASPVLSLNKPNSLPRHYIKLFAFLRGTLYETASVWDCIRVESNGKKTDESERI